jgi:hypothetical protein
VGVASFGCPQLLEDGFEVNPALPATGLDSGEHPSLNQPDASATTLVEGGAAGIGGAPNTLPGGGSAGEPSAGAGGSLTVDPPAAGTGGAIADPPDAGPTFVPVTELGALLVHRYRFDGTGSNVTDLVGGADGTTVGALQANGKVSLAGNEQYVDLPNGIISALESVSIEVWVNWLTSPASPEAAWQALFSFGASSNGEGQQGTGTGYIYVMPKNGDTEEIHGGYSLSGEGGEVSVDGEQALPQSANAAQGTQVVLVLNGAQGSLSVYINGALEVGTTSGTGIDLSAINDVNNWLGRSQYSFDPEFVGEFLDVRIYGSALSGAQVTQAFNLGANADL